MSTRSILARVALFAASFAMAASVWAATSGTLTVRVVDAGAEPVAGALVSLFDGDRPVASAPTDAAGAVTFEQLDPGAYDIVWDGGTACAQLQGQPVLAGRTSVVELTGGPCAPPRTVRGTVLTKEVLARVPSGRSYQQATQMASGVTVGPGGQFGSTAPNPNIGGAASVDPRRGEGFTDHGVGGVALVERDPWSTFAIDVDTASFALARSSLSAGMLPDPASVRVEEFVNAQQYHDASPVGSAPFAASLEIAPDPFQPGHHVMRVGLRGADAEIDRAPVHLTFLVDTSGSMAGADRLELAQRALHELVEALGPADRVALVTYAGSTRVVLRPTLAVEGADVVHGAIDRLTSGGGTAMSSGLELAYGLAAEHAVHGAENRVIVLSDGDANLGATTHEQMLAAIRDYAERGITMTTVGFGRGNYQDTLMEQLADQGDGNYHFIDSLAEARRVFGRDLAGTMITIARDVKVQVEFDPSAVVSYRLLGYENRDVADADFRRDEVDAGEMGSGHTVTALYDLVLRDDPGETLAVLRVRSKPPGSDSRATERTVTLPTGAVRGSFAAASADYRIARTTAAFAELLRHSPYVEELTYGEVAELARRARRNDDDDALIALMEQADHLTRR